MHKAKFLFFGYEIAIATFSRQLFNVCGTLIVRKKKPSFALHVMDDGSFLADEDCWEG